MLKGKHSLLEIGVTTMGVDGEQRVLARIYAHPTDPLSIITVSANGDISSIPKKQYAALQTTNVVTIMFNPTCTKFIEVDLSTMIDIGEILDKFILSEGRPGLNDLKQTGLELLNQLEEISEKGVRMHTDIMVQQWMSHQVMMEHLVECTREINDEKAPVYQKLSEVAKSIYELNNPEYVFEPGQTGYMVYDDLLKGLWSKTVTNVIIPIKILELHYDLIRVDEADVEPICMAKVSYQTVDGPILTTCAVNKISKTISR